jgi:hypothetical protein
VVYNISTRPKNKIKIILPILLAFAKRFGGARPSERGGKRTNL